MIVGSPGIYLSKTMTNSPPQPTLEALLAHSRWVRALAGSLVADSNSAQDVEQEVWLKALKSPPKHASNLRGWLASVVRNTVAQRGRGDGRRAARHELLNRESDGSTGAGPHQEPPSTPRELAERSETFQALARAIGELQEPYSSTIYLRYVEELPVAEVAMRQGVGVPTATSRINRGLELMREQMQGRFGGDWRSRCLVFTPFAAQASDSLVAAGVIAMKLKKKVLIGAGLLAFVIPVTMHLAGKGIQPDEPETGGLVMMPETKVEDSESAVLAQLGDSPRSEVTEPVRAEVEPPAIADVPDDPLALQVVVRDATTLEPVGAAEVLYFDRASTQDAAWGRDQFSRHEDMETLLDRYGDRYTADAAGHVVLPSRKSYAYIGARLDGKFASTYLFEEPQVDGGTQVELLLRPTTMVPVRVVDHLGRPVSNQRVELQNSFGENFAQCLMPTLSDEKGIARFKNIQERLADASPNMTYQFALPIPGGVVAHEFPPKELPTEQITLKLPEVGDVRILLRDPDGDLPAGRPYVLLQAYDPRDAESNFSSSNALRGSRRERSNDGEILFKSIALNTKVVAWIQTQGRAEPVEVIGQGPVVHGQEVTLTLPIPPKPSVLDLLVLDGEGQPLPDRALSLRQVVLMNGREVDPIHLSAGTNKVGRLRVRQGRLVEPDAPGAASATMMTMAIQVEEGCARWGVTTWPALVTSGEVDRGEFVLGPEEVSSGVVHDDQGQPLSFAELTMRIPTPWPNGEEHQIWTRFKADKEGRFRVFGEGLKPGTELEIDVIPPTTEQQSSAGRRQHNLIVGQLDQVLRMKADSPVAGRILISEEVPRAKLRLFLELTDARGQLVHHHLDLEPTNGRYSRGGLRPGLAQLVLMGSADMELARSEHFRTDAAGELTPPSWKALDMRDRIFVHRLQVKASVGTHPERVTVKLKDSGLKVTEVNPVTLVTAHEHLSVAVEAVGFRPVEQVLVPGESEMELAVGVPVTFTLPAGVNLPEGRWEVRLQDSFSSVLGSGDTYPLDSGLAGNSWAHAISQPGTYLVGLVLTTQPSGTNGPVMRVSVNWSDGQRYGSAKVSESVDPQVILLDVTQQAIDKAVDATRQALDTAEEALGR